MVSSRQHLTIYEKNELRRYNLAHTSLKHADLQQWVVVHLKKCIGLSTVGKIVNQPLDSTPNGNMKKKRKPQHASIESELLAFVHLQQEKGLLSDEVLQVKANELVGENTISLSWIQCFKVRHGVTLHKMHGEAGSVDTADLGQQRTVLMELLDQYNPEDSFNMDETALFYRMLPSQTLATNAVAGKKKDKAQISIGLCCNFTGTEKLKPIVINRAARPRCFRGVDIGAIPMEYFSNQKAWMTTEIFFKWVRALNLKMHDRKVLLLDNASGHADVELSDVRIHFLPKKHLIASKTNGRWHNPKFQVEIQEAVCAVGCRTNRTTKMTGFAGVYKVRRRCVGCCFGRNDPSLLSSYKNCVGERDLEGGAGQRTGSRVRTGRFRAPNVV